jgi:hypothetical protein
MTALAHGCARMDYSQCAGCYYTSRGPDPVPSPAPVLARLGLYARASPRPVLTFGAGSDVSDDFRGCRYSRARLAGVAKVLLRTEGEGPSLPEYERPKSVEGLSLARVRDNWG